MKQIEVFLLDEKATVPTRNHTTDAGLDLYALDNVFVLVGSTAIIKTGVAIKVPDGYVGLLKERSSIGKQGLKVAGGVIDSGYSGDISILIVNISKKDWMYNPEKNIVEDGYLISKGDRIAQLVLMPVITPTPVVVSELWSSDRGSKKFGSSGA